MDVPRPSLAGRTLGRYRLEEQIGAGGMGEVYRAHDDRLSRVVAIKVIAPHLLDKEQARERFEREARAIAAFSHPHICTVYDVGSADGVEFLVMEHLEGETLASRLARQGEGNLCRYTRPSPSPRNSPTRSPPHIVRGSSIAT